MNLIKKFEEFTGVTIWKMIAADRLIGWNDHVGNYATYIEEKLRCDREYVIAKVANEIRGISRMFNDFEPDILIPSDFICNFCNHILAITSKIFIYVGWVISNMIIPSN